MDVFIYDQIGVGFLNEGVTLKDIQEQTGKSKDKEITVHINSNGGDVREGFAIHDYLTATGKNIKTIIEGKCYSIATVIFLAGNERLMQENAELMIHNPWGMAEGDADEIEKYSEWIRENEDRLAKFYVEKTNLELDEAKNLMKETTFMDADEAIVKGFATAKVEPMKAVALINKTMSDFTDEQKSWLEKKLKKLEGIFKAKASEPKNIMVKVNDGSEIFVESEDGSLMGKKVFKVSEGERTEESVADGVYTLEDGKKITVADGVISAVEEPAEDSIEDLKNRISELETENESLKAEKESAETKAQEAETELKDEQEKVKEVQASLKEIRTKVFGENPPKKPRPEPKATEGIDAMFQGIGEQIIKDYQ